MKIAIPSMDNSSTSLISNTLGRSPYIIIYDNESEEYSTFPNPGFHLQDGSGIQAADIIISNKAGVLLTLEIGRKAYSILMKENIDIQLLSSGGKVKSVIDKFLKKQHK